jgi:excisionase family DNA binding protein
LEIYVLDETNTAERMSVQVEPLLLRKDEAARVLGMSSRTFEDLVLAGLIGKVQIGGLVLYDVEELRAFVRQVRREGLSKTRLAALIESRKAERRALPAKSSPGQEFAK